MDIEIKTKFDIGDTVYALLSKMNAENRYIDRRHEYCMELYAKKIVAIRYYKNINGENEIHYFLEGLYSYEGENWFIEPIKGDIDNYYSEERIFADKKDAYKAYNYYKYMNTLIDLSEKIENLLENGYNEINDK